MPLNNQCALAQTFAYLVEKLGMDAAILAMMAVVEEDA